jgi:hypothetical protein
MTLDAAYAGRLRQIAEMPAAMPPATLGDIWRAEWAASGLDTMETTIDPFRSAYDDLAKRVSDTGGKGLAVLADQYGVDLGQTRGIGDQVLGLERLIDRLPEDQRKALEPHRDVVGNARRNAREIEKRAEDVGASTYGLSGYATSFAAGVSRQMVSPVNLALMPLGGPLTGSGVRGVAGMLAREAAYGAAGQAIQEPVIAAGREQLGLETSSIENIAQAAIGQAGLAGVLRAGAAGFRAMQEYRGARAAATEARQAAEFAPFDFAAGAPQAPRTGGPFGAGLDQAGRLALAPGEVPRIDLPEGVVFPPQAARSAVGDRTGTNPDRLSVAAADIDVRFGELQPQAAQSAVGDDYLSGPMRDVATRLEPEDFDAIALLEERNAVIDVAARDLLSAPRVAVPAVRRPMSMGEFIGRNGGITLTPDAKAMGLDRMFIPRGGPVARKSGRSLDWWINKLTEEGYLEALADGYNRADLEVYDDILNALRDENVLKQRKYRRSDEVQAVEFQVGSKVEADNARWEGEIAAREDEVRRALNISDEDSFAIDPRDISRAAELLARGDVEDAIVAFDRAAMERMRADPEIAAIVAPVYRDDFPGWDDADFSTNTRQGSRGAETGVAAGSRPGQESASGRGRTDDAAAGIAGGETRPQSLDEATLLSGDAVEAAAAAMEHGRVAPQPLAFRPTTVSASSDAFRTATAFEIAMRARPDVADLVAAARKAGDPDEANPFTNVFFTDATRAVPVPADVAIKRITKATERAASAEAVGAPRWSVGGIAALAARIDTPVSELPTPRQAVPRGEAVRVRVLRQAQDEADPRSSSPKGDSTLSLKDALRVQSVDRQLAEIGDAPIVVGDKVTTARTELARLADERQALDALDACRASSGGDAS